MKDVVADQRVQKTHYTSLFKIKLVRVGIFSLVENEMPVRLSRLGQLADEWRWRNLTTWICRILVDTFIACFTHSLAYELSETANLSISAGCNG